MKRKPGSRGSLITTWKITKPFFNKSGNVKQAATLFSLAGK